MAAVLPKGEFCMRKVKRNLFSILSLVIIIFTFMSVKVNGKKFKQFSQNVYSFVELNRSNANKKSTANEADSSLDSAADNTKPTSVQAVSKQPETSEKASSDVKEVQNQYIFKAIAPEPIVPEPNGQEMDAQAVSSGIVRLKHSSSAKLKVKISKGSSEYTYDLRNDGVYEAFPLQMGSGNYLVTLFENVSGTSYKVADSWNINVEISNPLTVYLNSIQNVNWNHSMAAIQKAKQLVADAKSDDERVKAIYDYVVNNFTYDDKKLNNLPTGYIPSIENMYNQKSGICYDYAALMAAMLRSVGVPTKLVKGSSTNISGYHAWNEVYMRSSQTWIIVDTTYDSQIRAAGSSYNMSKPRNAYTEKYEY